MERTKAHPIFIFAGIAVLLFSLLGAAAVTGVGSAEAVPVKTGALLLYFQARFA